MHTSKKAIIGKEFGVECGDEDQGTHHTEKLALINSFAVTSGCEKHHVPCPDLSLPSIKNNFKEVTGFACRTAGEDVSNPTTSKCAHCNGVDTNAEANDDDLASLLLDLDFGLDGDVEVDFDDSEPLEVEQETMRRLDFAESADKAQTSDLTHEELIEHAVQRLLPPQAGGESAPDSFRGLTLEALWIPFHAVNSTKPKMDVDEEEAQVSPGGPKGFSHLERSWNSEAAKAFGSWMTGEELKLVDGKSTQQSMDCHTKKKSGRD